MDTESENKYFAGAIEALELADEFDAPPKEWKALVATQCANAVATLALAYEQRTANLIAVQHADAMDLSTWPDKEAQEWLRFSKEISTRLGLDTAEGDDA